MIVIIHEAGKNYAESFANIEAQSRSDWICVIPVSREDDDSISLPSDKFQLVSLPEERTFQSVASMILEGFGEADYFTFKSEFDVWSPNYLNSMVRALESHQKLLPAVHGAICHSTLVWPDGHKTHEGFISEGLLDLTELYMEKALCPGQVFMDRLGIYNGAAETIHDGAPEAGVEFWDFLLRSTKSSEYVIVPQYLVTQKIVAEEAGTLNRQLVQKIHRQHALNERIRNWDYSVIFGALYTAVDRLENVLLSQSQEIQRLSQQLENHKG